jgi:hypothetical protein
MASDTVFKRDVNNSAIVRCGGGAGFGGRMRLAPISPCMQVSGRTVLIGTLPNYLIIPVG